MKICENQLEIDEMNNYLDAFFSYILKDEYSKFLDSGDNKEIKELLQEFPMSARIDALEYAVKDHYFVGTLVSPKNEIFIPLEEIFVEGATAETVNNPIDWVFDESGGYYNCGYGFIIEFDMEKLKEYCEESREEYYWSNR